MTTRLLLEEVADELQIPKAQLRRGWAQLVNEDLAFQEKVVTGTLQWTNRDLLPDLFVKMFWIMLETQKPGGSTPPFLKQHVAPRIYKEVRGPKYNYKQMSRMFKIEPNKLKIWLNGERMVSVTSFERFIMEYAGEDLFNYINIIDDVSLQNVAHRKEEDNEQ